MANNGVMAPKKKPTDRHKPNRLVRVPERVAAAVEAIGLEDEIKLTQMVKMILIEYLKERGKWPPLKGG